MRPRPRLPSLLRAASRARAKAYAPYSGFQVGAAVLAEGRVFAAGNVENSAYPLSVCAERNAVAMAVAAGHRRIDAVAVVAGEDQPAAPCGGCRQVIAEFCGARTPVIYAARGGRSVTTDVGALLPDAFRADALGRAAGAGAPNADGHRAAARVRRKARGRRSR
jgi:cytidine deaminase